MLIYKKQSNRWQITINNPLKYGYTHEKIKTILSLYKDLVYWCMADEIAPATHTPHTHIYFVLRKRIWASTLLDDFKNAYITSARGTSRQNRDYIFKQGEKWENSDKKETNLAETHEEFGEIPHF